MKMTYKSACLLSLLILCSILSGLGCSLGNLYQAAESSTHRNSTERSYPPPISNDFVYKNSREKQNLKGPVKSVSTEYLGVPAHFYYTEYYPDGKIKQRTGGRSFMNYETNYWYNDRGYLSKEQNIDYGYDGDSESSQTLYLYEYDELGYPVKITEKTECEGRTYESQFVYVYADTTYSKEWWTEPSDYFPAYEYRETYDSKGRIASRTATNSSNGSVSLTKYSYIPDRHIVIEETDWDGSRFNKKKVTTYSPNGAVEEWILYDGSDAIISKETNTLDANGHCVASVFYYAEDGTTRRETFKYTYDESGNPLSVICTADGEVDHNQSSNTSYEYYR